MTATATLTAQERIVQIREDLERLREAAEAALDALSLCEEDDWYSSLIEAKGSLPEHLDEAEGAILDARETLA